MGLQAPRRELRRRELCLAGARAPRSLEARLRTLGVDAGFVRFLREKHSPTWESDEVIPNADQKLRNSEFRKMKRGLERGDPEHWKEIWRNEYLPELKAQSKAELHLRTSSTRSEITYVGLPNPHVPDDVRRAIVRMLEGAGVPRPTAIEMVGWPRRPRDPVWPLVWLLKTYFELIARGPCWSVIAEIIERDYDTLESGWQKNKKRFDMLNAEAFLCSELNAYERACPQAGVSPFLTTLHSKLEEKEHVRQQRRREIIEIAKTKALAEWSSFNDPIHSDTRARALQEIERTLSACISDEILEHEITESRSEVKEVVRQVLDGERMRRRAREGGPTQTR